MVARGSCALIVLGIFLAGCRAVDQESLLHRHDKMIGAHTGYSFGTIENAQMITTHVRLGYILYRDAEGQDDIPLLPHGALEVALEPFFSVIFENRNAGEAGIAIPAIAYYFDTGTRLFPFVEGGVGGTYTGLTGFDLGEPFQFVSFGGGGLSYFLSNRLALRFSARFRHISNAGIAHDNDGLNSVLFTLGFSWRFGKHEASHPMN